LLTQAARNTSIPKNFRPKYPREGEGVPPIPHAASLRNKPNDFASSLTTWQSKGSVQNVLSQSPALRFPALALSLALAASGVAQTPQQQALPTAPSTLLAEQGAPAPQPAGSGIVFHAPSTAQGPGGAPVEQPTAGPLRLSLDDAVSYGLQRNVELKYQKANQREVKGDELGVVNALLPSLNANFSAEAQQINLAALGFNPNKIGAELGINPALIPVIVKVNTLQADISASQELFDLTAYELYRGSQREVAVVNLNYLNARGDLVQSIGTGYLRVLADKSALDNAREQERASNTAFSQATDRQKAGVGTSLDALRAQVDYQQRQQYTVAAEATLAKDTIQLNRIMGLPAGQQLELTDSAPFNSLADLDIDRAKAAAYLHRKDLLSLQQQVQVDDRELRAVRYQRLPVLAFNGYYGVLGATEIPPYHGVFNAFGTLKFPIFREAEQRGQEQAVSAQLQSVRDRVASLKDTIDQQIRSAMLDVEADRQLVEVAQSNVSLSQQELSDARDRFTAGVDDNLPLIDAEATVTGAQAQLVQALFQYNVAKLNLARNIGLVETRYRDYLGPLVAPPAAPAAPVVAPTTIPPSSSSL
jgi:outer membrane protein TolC